MNSTQSLNMYMQAMKVIRHISLLKFPGVLWVIIVSVFYGIESRFEPTTHSVWRIGCYALRYPSFALGGGIYCNKKQWCVHLMTRIWWQLQTIDRIQHLLHDLGATKLSINLIDGELGVHSNIDAIYFSRISCCIFNLAYLNSNNIQVQLLRHHHLKLQPSARKNPCALPSRIEAREKFVFWSIWFLAIALSGY